MTLKPIPSPLESSIDRLYKAFAKYPRVLSPRSAYTETRDLARIKKLTKNLALREIPAAETWQIWEEFTGGLDAVKHFLPRVLELSVTSSDDIRQIDENGALYLAYLHRAPLKSWPKEEREALLEFCLARWNASLVRPEIFEVSIKWLSSLVAYFRTISPFLEAWTELRSLRARCLLLIFLVDVLPEWEKANDRRNGEFPFDTDHGPFLKEASAWAAEGRTRALALSAKDETMTLSREEFQALTGLDGEIYRRVLSAEI